jgi:hypothetical protein
MRTIKLTPTEFYKFRNLAFSLGIAFMCSIVESMYVVVAHSQKLEQLGY